MKKQAKLFLLAAFSLMTVYTQAQNDSMYIMKNHNIISVYNLTNTDSIIFYNPYNHNLDKGTNDSLFVLKAGRIIGNHSIADVDSILFKKPTTGLIPLPRIGTREGTPYAEFYNTHTGEVFKPIGSNYVKVVVDNLGNVNHSAFAVGLYNPESAEEALKKMEECGFNLVRVFCFRGQYALRPILSVEGPYETNTPELYQPYLDNLFDFLERATRHRIYVQITIDQTPQNTYYNNLVASGYPQIETTMHREYMVPNAIIAKEIYIDKLIQGIIKHNPGLLTTIFAYEIRNEIHSETSLKPFSLTTGLVTTASGEYDMGNAVSRQACQDDNISLYLNRCVVRIKQNDPAALATASSFMFLPVAKVGLAGKGLLPINTKDVRWPVRLNIMFQTKLDFIDVHSYLPYDFNQALESSLWYLVDKTKKPFLVGEFGAHRKDFSTVTLAANALYSYRQNFINNGFQGALLFTWDETQLSRWTMLEGGEVIMNKLKP